MINEVYNTVQAILNKNNYGVLTPDRFNSFAQSAQLKIMYEIHADLARLKLKKNRAGVMDAINLVQDSIDNFIERTNLRLGTNNVSGSFNDYFELPTDFLFEESVWYLKTIRLDELDKKNGMYVVRNKLTAPTRRNPLFERRGNRIYTFPEDLGVSETATGFIANEDVSLYYFRKPKIPKWTSLITPSGQAVFNPADASYIDFELKEYYFNRLVVDISLLAGVRIREEEVDRFAQQEQRDNLERNTIA